MSKVLVDRELLERCVDRWACCAIVETPGAEQAWLELRAVVKAAQPAEADGFQIARHSKRLVEQLREQLSAVTAERDRLREEMAELWKRIDKFQSQSHGITALAEIERLRAEVGRYVPLHEAVQHAADELPEGWAIQLYIERDGGGVELIGPDGTEDFATNNERLDYTVIDALEAAMAAKEA